jgi:hypothetical protein
MVEVDCCRWVVGGLSGGGGEARERSRQPPRIMGDGRVARSAPPPTFAHTRGDSYPRHGLSSAPLFSHCAGGVRAALWRN